MELTFELAPRPGTTLSQRKLELDGTRFVAVRNLAHIHYKKPDGTQLMNYSETLGDREVVKQKILEYELAFGLIQNDGTGLISQPQQAQLAAPANGAQNGHSMQPAPMQQQMFNPAAAAPAPAAQVAQMQAPMQQQQFGAPPAQPQMVMPQQQMAPAPAPQQMMPQTAPAAEAAAPAAGQKPSRRKINNTGAAVAAPPAAPPPGPQTGPGGFPPAQQQMVPPQQQQAPFTPQQFPAAQQMASVQAAPVQMAPPAPQVAPQAAVVDLTPVMATLNQLGTGVSTAANNGDQLLKLVADLTAKVVQLGNDQQRILAALHHLYMMNTNPDLPKSLGDRRTVAQFKEYLTGFSLPAGTP